MTAAGDRQRGDLLAATGENLMTVDSLEHWQSHSRRRAAYVRHDRRVRQLSTGYVRCRAAGGHRFLNPTLALPAAQRLVDQQTAQDASDECGQHDHRPARVPESAYEAVVTVLLYSERQTVRQQATRRHAAAMLSGELRGHSRARGRAEARIFLGVGRFIGVALFPTRAL